MCCCFSPLQVLLFLQKEKEESAPATQVKRWVSSGENLKTFWSLSSFKWKQNTHRSPVSLSFFSPSNFSHPNPSSVHSLPCPALQPTTPPIPPAVPPLFLFLFSRYLSSALTLSERKKESCWSTGKHNRLLFLYNEKIKTAT